MNYPDNFDINNCTPAYVAGITSGASPIVGFVDDPLPTTLEVFLFEFGWSLLNNGLVMEEHNILN